MNTNLPRVWVIKEQMMRGDLGSVAMDYSPALKYGELEFITTHDLPLHGKGSAQESWFQHVSLFCSAYDPERDYIITTGQPMAIFMVGYYLGLKGKLPRFLVWRPQENQYRVVSFDAVSPATA